MSHIVACPRCSTQIRVPDWNTHKTLLCPRCLADVDNARPGFQIRAADINTDVKRDMRVGNIVIAVLIGLCVLGIAMARNPEMPLGLQLTILFFSLPALFVLVCMAIIRGLARRGIVENVFGCIFLVLGTTAAIIIFVWFACAIAMSNMQFGR